MNYGIEEIEGRLRSGEDSGWEFKQVEFAGGRPKRPTRSDWVDEIAAFATVAGVLLCCCALQIPSEIDITEPDFMH